MKNRIALTTICSLAVSLFVLAPSAMAQFAPDDGFAGPMQRQNTMLARNDDMQQGGGFRPNGGQFGGRMGRMSGGPQGSQQGGGPQGPQQGGGDREALHQRMMQELGLSQEQMDKMKSLREQGRSQAQALQQQLRTKQQALMQYMQSSDATESGARAKFSEVNNLQRQLGELRLKSWFQMRQTLTPEQREKIKQAFASRRQQRGDGPNGGGQGNFGNGRFRQGGGHFGGEQGPFGQRGSFGPSDGGPDGAP